MKPTLRNACLSALVLSVIAIAPARADDDHDGNSLHWRTIVGIVNAGNAVGSGSGAVLGGGQPWTTLGGKASVNVVKGRIAFDVRGLVFAGGNGVGTPGPIVQVKGTLVCDTDGSAGGGNSELVDTPLVALDDEGNASFSGAVALPAVCTAEPDIAFLVRVPAGRWIANGAVLH
jgi:hypothetical protein